MNDESKKIYIAMHDDGHEYRNDSIGSIIGAFATREKAIQYLLFRGYIEEDRYMNFWKGRDRAWIHETTLD